MTTSFQDNFNRELERQIMAAEDRVAAAERTLLWSADRDSFSAKLEGLRMARAELHRLLPPKPLEVAA